MSLEIETYVNQIEAPHQILNDSRGTTIAEGLRVAYNRSGKLKLGKIVKVRRNEWSVLRKGAKNTSWWGLKFVLMVESEEGEFTLLRNPNSFIIV